MGPYRHPAGPSGRRPGSIHGGCPDADIRFCASKVADCKAAAVTACAMRCTVWRKIGSAPSWWKTGSFLSAGVFSERDFINAVASKWRRGAQIRVRDLMSAPIIGCRSSDRIDAVLATMTLRKNFAMSPLSMGNSSAEIVSIGDLVEAPALTRKELEANVLLDITTHAGLFFPRLRLSQTSHAHRWPQGVLGLAFQPSRCTVSERPVRRAATTHTRWHCGRYSVLQMESSSGINSPSVVAGDNKGPRRSEKEHAAM